MTVTTMPTFPELLVGLRRRGLRIEPTPTGGARLTGPADALARIDEIVVVAVRWHADLIRLMLIADKTGYVVGVCDSCGEWCLIRAGTSRRCLMTPQCPGKHHDVATITSVPSKPR